MLNRKASGEAQTPPFNELTKEVLIKYYDDILAKKLEGDLCIDYQRTSFLAQFKAGMRIETKDFKKKLGVGVQTALDFIDKAEQAIRDKNKDQKLERNEAKDQIPTGVKEGFKGYAVYCGAKEGGANKPGPFGGRYKLVQPGVEMLQDKQLYLFKQDTKYSRRTKKPITHHVEKDISEYVASQLMNQIFSGIAPEMGVHKDSKEGEPYISSKYFGAKQGERYEDFFKDIFKEYYEIPRLKQYVKLLDDNKESEAKGLLDAINEKEGKKPKGLNKLLKKLSAGQYNQNLITTYLKTAEKKDSVEERTKLLGTRQVLKNKRGVVFNESVKKRDSEGGLKYKDLEKCLVASIIVGDLDAHSGNFGVVIDAEGNKHVKRIDMGAALNKKYFKEEGLFNINDPMRMNVITLDPTNHLSEFPKEIYQSKKFIDALQEGIKKLQAYCEELKKGEDDDGFSENFNKWSEEARTKFADYIGVTKKEYKDDASLNEAIFTKYRTILEKRINQLDQLKKELEAKKEKNKSKKQSAMQANPFPDEKKVHELKKLPSAEDLGVKVLRKGLDQEVAVIPPNENKETTIKVSDKQFMLGRLKITDKAWVEVVNESMVNNDVRNGKPFITTVFSIDPKVVTVSTFVETFKKDNKDEGKGVYTVTAKKIPSNTSMIGGFLVKDCDKIPNKDMLIYAALQVKQLISVMEGGAPIKIDTKNEVLRKAYVIACLIEEKKYSVEGNPNYTITNTAIASARKAFEEIKQDQELKKANQEIGGISVGARVNVLNNPDLNKKDNGKSPMPDGKPMSRRNSI